jgi:hypothetical protein
VGLGILAVLLLVLNRPPDLASGATDRPASPTAPIAEVTASPAPPASAGPSPSALLVIATPSPPPQGPTAPPTHGPTSRPTATANTNARIVSFSAPATVQCSSGEVVQISLSWRVERATGVELAIDGPGKFDDYPATATIEVPFACSESQHTYRITTIGGSGTPASQEKVVKRAS